MKIETLTLKCVSHFGTMTEMGSNELQIRCDCIFQVSILYLGIFFFLSLLPTIGHKCLYFLLVTLGKMSFLCLKVFKGYKLCSK